MNSIALTLSLRQKISPLRFQRRCALLLIFGIISSVLAGGLQAGGKNSKGANPSKELIVAAKVGDTQRVAQLLEADAGVQATDRYGRTALHWAAGNGHEGVVARLLEADADVQATDSYGSRALHWAAYKGHEGVVAQLLAAGADIEQAEGMVSVGQLVEVLTKNEMSDATRVSLTAWVHSRLSETSAERVTVRDTYGCFPLHYALTLGFDDLIAQLTPRTDEHNLFES